MNLVVLLHKRAERGDELYGNERAKRDYADNIRHSLPAISTKLISMGESKRASGADSSNKRLGGGPSTIATMRYNKQSIRKGYRSIEMPLRFRRVETPVRVV